MKIAFGILGVLLILAIVYYFLPQGIKTTFRGIFGGSNTTQTVKVSPTPAPSGTVAPSPSPSPSLVASARPSTTPAASGLLRSSTPTPRASTSATPRAATQSASAGLPQTGIQNQPIEVTLIQVLASALIVMIGLKLSRFV